MNTLKWSGIVAAALVAGYLLGSNTGGKWRVGGSGANAVLYNERTGVQLYQVGEGWGTKEAVDSFAQITAANDKLIRYLESHRNP